MPIWAIVLVVVVAVVLLLFVCLAAWVVTTYNKLIKLRNNAKEGYSTMDVYMKKRYDLIPNFVETVKGYAKHESEALEKVMKARYSSMNATTPAEKAEGENAITQTLGRLFHITESYPDLKANQNFMELQNQLKSLENEIANARKYYNGCVKALNNKIEVFPSNLIAKCFKFEQMTLFEIENKEQREAPQVKF